MRRLRFGYQVAIDGDVDSVRADAQRAEAAGFDIVQVADHLGTWWPALTTLASLAQATSRVRVGTLVLNNDFHHPVHLAREVAAIDHLSGGRVELGLGAGHSFPEYASIGLPFDPPAVRKARLAESVEILRALLDGERVTYPGRHYQLEGVRIVPALQPRLPILVGVNGRAALTHAAHHADAIGLTMLGRMLEDGQRHAVRWAPEHIDRTVAFIRDAAGPHGDSVELNALIQAVVVTDNREVAAGRIAERLEDLDVEDALEAPFLALGTHDQIAEHLCACRDRWGISYFSVRDIDNFAPVIARIRRMEADE